METTTHDIICIGSVLWDIVGRTEKHPGLGGDVGGHIKRVPGGVALNIAMTLATYNVRPTLLSCIGNDSEGDELLSRIKTFRLNVDHIFRSPDLRTDIYMAVECGNIGLVAAIADAHSLEAAGETILTPLFDGTLGSANSGFSGMVVLDGNLTADLLLKISVMPEMAKADLRLAPASPGKAERLIPLANHPNATIYVNRGEAETICGQAHGASAQSALKLVEMGFARALVSDGPNETAIADANGLITAMPPVVKVERITGAGDTLMASHIAAELEGLEGPSALTKALEQTAEFVSRPN